MIYDVAVVGAGIVGSSIARELSRYDIKICLIEKENDVSCGTSKANSGIIHAGYDPEPGTLMAKFNVEGCAMFEKLSQELHFDYKRVGSLVVGFSEEDMQHVQKLYERGKKNGVPDLRILSQDELRKFEPQIGEDALGALYAPTAGIISPYQATWAIAENAVQNGVKLFLQAEVHSIEQKDGLFLLNTGKGLIQCRYLVNAAGLYSDRVSAMAGGRSFEIKPKSGEYCLLDSNCRNLANHVLFQTPSAAGKGVLVTPTVDGNILIGPSAGDNSSREDTATTREGQALILEKGSKTIPGIPVRNIINSFCGNRAIAFNKDENGAVTERIGDFIVEQDAKVKNLFQAAGIASPGLTAAPAIAVYMCGLLKKAGLEMKENRDFVPVRKGLTKFSTASAEDKYHLIEENPLYGRIICRCEMITEAEIVAATHSVIGATDLDGVKRRTRSGMGRCQGGFCSPRITEIISRELGIPMTAVTKNGGYSYILCDRTREN